MKKLLIIIILTAVLVTCVCICVHAQTRFYLTAATGGTAISPAFGNANLPWNTTTNATRRNMSVTKDGSTLANSSASGSTASSQIGLVAQFVSAPLAAQTLQAAKGFKIQVKGLSSVATNGFLLVFVRVVTPAGADRGSIMTGGWNTGTAYTTSLVNRGTAGAYVNFNVYGGTDVSVSAGDYLVVEFGGYSASGSRTFTMNFGSSSATDMAEDQSSTAANNPWFEMQQTVTFQTVTATNKGMPLSILAN